MLNTFGHPVESMLNDVDSFFSLALIRRNNNSEFGQLAAELGQHRTTKLYLTMLNDVESV